MGGYFLQIRSPMYLSIPVCFLFGENLLNICSIKQDVRSLTIYPLGGILFI